MQSTLKIVTGTTSQLKINAILQAFQTLYPNHIISISGFEVDAGVPSAPIGDGIFTGAKQRALALKTTHDADFYVGIESGAFEIGENYLETTGAFILDKSGSSAFATGPGLFVPKIVSESIEKKGSDEVRSKSYETAIKSAREKMSSDPQNRDSVGMYTAMALTRDSVITVAVQTALMCIRSPVYKLGTPIVEN